MELQELIENLLSNQSNVEKLIPLAIQSLEENMLLKAKFYEGDLLMTVLKASDEFWKLNLKLSQQLNALIDAQFDKIKNQQVSFEMKGEWYGKIERFKRIINC